MEKPLINNTYLLEKFPGKGGWTYAQIDELKNQLKKTPFGWVKVKGSIDGFEIRKYSLMPMGNGNMFLPVKAEIRKSINKREGDKVRIILYPDNDPLILPEEMRLCLEDEPQALHFFNSLTESEQKFYIDWIYSAKQEKTKVDRLAKTINRLVKGLKLYS